MQGSGATLGTVDLGPLGTLEVRDDGDNDNHLYVKMYDDSGSVQFAERCQSLRDRRKSMGDTDFMDWFDKQSADESSAPSWTPDGGVGFVCDECGRLWASKRNQTPGNSDDICPDCIDQWQS